MIGTRGNKHKLQEGKLQLDISKKKYCNESSQIGQRAHRRFGISILGNTQNSISQGPEQPGTSEPCFGGGQVGPDDL